MPLNSSPDYWSLLGALGISFISGFISISNRVLSGHPATILWIVSEFTTAVLFGYLTYNAYPSLAQTLPEWVTMPVAVAISAHIGGRIFQEIESALVKKYGTYLSK